MGKIDIGVSSSSANVTAEMVKHSGFYSLIAQSLSYYKSKSGLYDFNQSQIIDYTNIVSVNDAGNTYNSIMSDKLRIILYKDTTTENGIRPNGILTCLNENGLAYNSNLYKIIDIHSTQTGVTINNDIENNCCVFDSDDKLISYLEVLIEQSTGEFNTIALCIGDTVSISGFERKSVGFKTYKGGVSSGNNRTVNTKLIFANHYISSDKAGNNKIILQGNMIPLASVDYKMTDATVSNTDQNGIKVFNTDTFEYSDDTGTESYDYRLFSMICCRTIHTSNGNRVNIQSLFSNNSLACGEAAASISSLDSSNNVVYSTKLNGTLTKTTIGTDKKPNKYDNAEFGNRRKISGWFKYGGYIYFGYNDSISSSNGYYYRMSENNISDITFLGIMGYNDTFMFDDNSYIVKVAQNKFILCTNPFNPTGTCIKVVDGFYSKINNMIVYIDQWSWYGYICGNDELVMNENVLLTSKLQNIITIGTGNSVDLKFTFSIGD